MAELHPTAGNKVSGTVTFTEEADGVRVQANITGLTPGEHGFHVHEFGDCSAPDLASAGGHFNPTNKPHGGPDAAERHVGDMGSGRCFRHGEIKLCGSRNIAKQRRTLGYWAIRRCSRESGRSEIPASGRLRSAGCMRHHRDCKKSMTVDFSATARAADRGLE